MSSLATMSKLTAPFGPAIEPLPVTATDDGWYWYWYAEAAEACGAVGAPKTPSAFMKLQARNAPAAHSATPPRARLDAIVRIVLNRRYCAP
jgi:hypothetical protein